MKDYLISITETLEVHLVVNAKDEEEALRKAEEEYSNGNIVLTADDFREKQSFCEGLASESDKSIYTKI